MYVMMTALLVLQRAARALSGFASDVPLHCMYSCPTLATWRMAGQPSDVHERIPTFLGSVEDVLELEGYGDVQQLGNKKYAV